MFKLLTNLSVCFSKGEPGLPGLRGSEGAQGIGIQGEKVCFSLYILVK